MSISFNSIPTGIRTPGQYIEINGNQALQGLPALPQVALIVAPRLSTGTVAAATPFLISSGAGAEAAFGRHSIGSFMGKAFKNANPYTEVWGIGVADNGSGVAATGSVVFTGPATAAGALSFYIGGQLVPVAVTVGMTATQLGDALVAAMALLELPITGVNTTGTVALTARNAGTTGNRVDLRMNYNQGDATPAGIAVVITAMSGGATDGSVSGAIAAIGAKQYHTMISAWDASAVLALFEAELFARWGPMEQIEGIVFAGTYGSQGTMATAGNARNSFLSVLFGVGLSPTPTYVAAAAVGAVSAFQATIDPFRPFTTLPIPGMLPPAAQSQLTRAERNILLTDGVSTYTIDPSGVCLLERLITTYQSTSGIADATYLDIMTVRGVAALRYTQRAIIALKYPRHKLADDGTTFGPGQAIVTPGIIRSELLMLFLVWEDNGWVQDFDAFKAGLIVARNPSDVNRLDVLMPPTLINAFLVYAANLQFLL